MMPLYNVETITEFYDSRQKEIPAQNNISFKRNHIEDPMVLDAQEPCM